MSAKKTSQSVQAPRYSRDELLANSEAIFSVKPEVFAGALHGDHQSEMTIQEAKKRIDQYLKRKVN